MTETTRRIKMIVQYDGAPFQGWQIQPSGAPTVQAAVESALGKLLGHAVRVTVAGRTDTGVHAMAMPVHFDTTCPIPAGKLPVALPKYLPEQIGIVSAEEVPGFEARRQAIMRWYRYQIHMTSLRYPLGPRAWHVYHRLNLDSMHAGLELIRGEHDFEGFRAAQCQAQRTVLTMEQARMQVAGNLLAIDFKCRSFLHHMIRFLTGTLVSLGMGQMDLERVRAILETGDRPQLIQCAPPEGLCLMGVAYTETEKAALLAENPAPPSF